MFPNSKPYNIFLIGDVDPKISGDKLPSNLQVLKVLFFHVREVGMQVKDAAKLVIDEVMPLWQKARLPTRQPIHCRQKLEALYKEWRDVKKNEGRQFNKTKEEAFFVKLKTIFDIAHADILKNIDGIQKEFFMDQQKPEPVGRISDLQAKYDIEDRAREEKKETYLRRVQKSEKEKAELNEFIEFASSDENTPIQSQQSIGSYSSVTLDDDNDEEYIDASLSQPGPSAPKKTRGTINIFNEELVAVLDHCQISDSKAVRLVATIAKRLGHDLNSLIINKTSIIRYRDRLREAKAKNIKKVFQEVELNSVVLHWDGKIIYNMIKREALDRLPVVITNGDVEKLLGIPELENGTGEAQAKAIYEVLDDWGLCGSIKALCCDTTASNLGSAKGAGVLLEHLLKKNILFLPCRHHIFEIVLRAVFDAKMPPSSGPDVAIFKRFKECWVEIDLSKYKSGIEDENVRKVLENHVETIKNYVEETLKVRQPRDDYKELLELTLIFLGVTNTTEVRFRPPGAMHHARWMAKAIYSLKIYIFRQCFNLTSREERGLREICIFVVMIYVKAWFMAPLAPQSPYHDLKFLKELSDFKAIDSQISQVTLKKFINHLYYITPEVVAMAFFDETLTVDLKRKMVTELADDETFEDETVDNIPKKIIVKFKDVDSLLDKDLDHFITPQCLKFFDRFQINKQFLNSDPSKWSQNENFKHGLSIVSKLKVVNDPAERAVRLIEDYNNILTRNEKQKQYIIQLITEYRKEFPDAKKETLMKNFE